jgi:hypothetical protein
MDETFSTRIPKLPDSELLDYVQNCSKYKTEAIEIAVIELRKRGHTLTEDQLRAIQKNNRQHNAAGNSCGFLTDESFNRLARRLRFTAVMILIIGLGGSIIIYLNAEPTSLHPLGYDILTTKKYLREMELYGGKINVLATRAREWFEGLWHGKSLACTVAVLSVSLASLLWFFSTCRQTDKKATTRSKDRDKEFST